MYTAYLIIRVLYWRTGSKDKRERKEDGLIDTLGNSFAKHTTNQVIIACLMPEKLLLKHFFAKLFLLNVYSL